MLRRFGFLIVAVLIAASPAAAQDERPVKLTIGGGFTGVYGGGSDHLGNGRQLHPRRSVQDGPVTSIQGEYAWNGMKQKRLSLPVFATPLDTASVPSDFFADANMQYFDVNLLLHPSRISGGKTAGTSSPGWASIIAPSRSRRPQSAMRPCAIPTGTCATRGRAGGTGGRLAQLHRLRHELRRRRQLQGARQRVDVFRDPLSLHLGTGSATAVNPLARGAPQPTEGERAVPADYFRIPLLAELSRAGRRGFLLRSRGPAALIFF